MNASGERPRCSAKPAGKERAPSKIAALATWVATAVAIGFGWGIVETLVVRVSFDSGPYLHRDLVHALKGVVIFYGAITVLLSAFLTAVIWLWKRIRRRSVTMRAAGRYALLFSAATGAYVNLAFAIFPYWRDKYELARHAPQLVLLTALSAAALLGAAILILAWLRRRSSLLRRAFLLASYSFLAAALVAGASSIAYQQYRLLSRPRAAGLPDVVVITLDAWRADAFNDELTPNLREYARNNGMIYTNARAFSSWTLPSFAAALTGTYNVTDSHGIRTANDNIPAWAEVMRNNGYDTYAILSNPHLDTIRAHFRGFSHFYYVNNKPFLSHLHFYGTAPYFAVRGKKYRAETPGATTRRLTEKTRALLRRPSRRPKFVWVHILDPHFPYQPLPRVLEETAPSLLDKVHYGTDRKAFTEDKADIYKKLYEGELRSTDLFLAPLLSELEAKDETLVIISSDHGEEFFEHGGREHGRTLYDEVCKVPLVVVSPRAGGSRPRVGVTDAPVNLVDVAPSALKYLGLQVTPTMEGQRDLFSQNPPRNRPIYLSLNRAENELYALVEGEIKIIAQTRNGVTTTEYFDLKADPTEKKPAPLDTEGEKSKRDLLRWVRGRGVVPGTGGEGSLFGDRADLEALGYM